MTLAWTQSGDTVAGWVQRSADNVTWADIASGDCSGEQADNTCTDTSSLTPNARYYYRVKAKDVDTNWSGYSGEANVTASTAGMWHFNERGATDSTPTSATDYSPNNRSISLTNAPFWTSSGRFGSSYSGSATAYGTINNTSALAFGANPFSVEAWFKTSTTGAYQAIVSRSNPSSPYQEMSLRIEADNKIGFWASDCGTGGCGWGTSRLPVYSTVTVTDGNWHHVVGVRTATQYLLYLDGALNNTRNETARVSDVAANINVGRSDYNANYFRGQIDGLRITTAALSATDIQNYYTEANAQPVNTYTLATKPVITSAPSSTNTTKPTISGTTSTNAPVKLFRSGVEIASTTASGTSFSFTSGTYSGALTSGANSLTVKSYNTLNAANESNAFSITVDIQSPTVPSNLNFSGASTTSITVNWNASSGGDIERYEVQKSLDGTTWDAAVNPDPLTATSYTYNSLTANTKYYFRVRAKDAAGNYSGYTGEIDSNGATGAWYFNEGSGTTVQDASGNGYNGTLSGTSYWSASGKYASAFSGSGDDHADIGSINLGTSHTLMLWKKTTSGNAALVGGPTAPQAYFLYELSSGSTIYYKVNGNSVAVPYTPANGAWQFIAVKRSGTTVKFYVNGVQVGTDQTLPSNDPLTINRISGFPDNSSKYTGLIDSMVVFNNANPDIAAYYAESNAHPKFAYTLRNTPVLDTPTSPTNDTTPTVTNSGSVDATLANATIRLYVDGVHEVSTVANGSGLFNFTNADYATSSYEFPYGEHTIYATALGAGGDETPASGSKTLNVDTEVPTAPNVPVSAWTDSGKETSVADNAWNGHNNGESLYFEWPGATDPLPLGQTYVSNIKRYHVYFGANSSADPAVEGTPTLNSTASGTISLNTPVSGNDYYLRIKTEDNAGNISDAVTAFTYKFDNVRPTEATIVTPSPVGWSTNNSFSFSWNNWTETSSGLDYYLYVRKTSSTEDTYEAIDADSRKVSDVTNPINLNDIEALFTGINYIRVYAVDKAGNVSTVYASAPFFYSGVVTGPTVVATPAYNTVNSFGFNITKPGGITPSGYYCGTSASIDASNSAFIDVLTPPASVVINGKTTNVTVNNGDVTLSAFAAATQTGINRLYCATKDNMGNIGWANATSGAFTVETSAPAIPGTISITDASNRGENIWALTVAWAPIANPTPDFSGYKVYRCVDADCSNNDNYTYRAAVSTNIYSEAGLDNTKDYYYKIKSMDNVDNLSDYSASVHRTPTGKYTTPPTYTSNPVTEAKATSVSIRWTTNRQTNTIVQYGTTNSYGQEQSKSTEEVTDHQIEIQGLTPGTTYHYRVQSLDAERDYAAAAAYSQDYTFTTSQAPGISDVTVSEIRLTSVIITWKTTSSATSTILYGTTAGYGQTHVDNSGSQTTTHTVKLDNLKDSTTYNFKIQGTDIEGNVLNSDNYVFETLTYPKLSDLEIEQVKNTASSTVKINFKSNVPTTARVVVAGRNRKEASIYDLKQEHETVIAGLADNSEYTISVNGRDQYGNESTSLSRSFKTAFDTRPPMIFNVTTESSITGYGAEAKGQVILSWETDEPSSSQVVYDIGTGGEEHAFATEIDATPKTTHVVVISGLKPSTVYHFHAVAKDNSNNTTTSEEVSILTDQAAYSVFEMIINSLESRLGWLFRIIGGQR